MHVIFSPFVRLEIICKWSWYGLRSQKLKFYFTLGDHCSYVSEPIWTKFVRYRKDFDRSFKSRKPYFSPFVRLEIICKWSVYGLRPLQLKFYCALGAHWIYVSEPIWTKFVRFWKDFERSLWWDQPRFFVSKRLEAICKWS